MKKTILALVIMLVTVTFTFARWALIPLDKLIQESDLVVIGTLEDVKEYTKNDVDYGQGTITVNKVLWSTTQTSQKLTLTWENASNIACPRIGHTGNQGQKAIWLLTFQKDGSVKADYPGRFVELIQKQEVIKIIKETKAIVSKK